MFLFYEILCSILVFRTLFLFFFFFLFCASSSHAPACRKGAPFLSTSRQSVVLCSFLCLFWMGGGRGERLKTSKDLEATLLHVWQQTLRRRIFTQDNFARASWVGWFFFLHCSLVGYFAFQSSLLFVYALMRLEMDQIQIVMLYATVRDMVREYLGWVMSNIICSVSFLC